MWGRLATCAAVGYRRRSTAKAAGADCQSAAGYQPAPQNLVRQPTPAQFFMGFRGPKAHSNRRQKTIVRRLIRVPTEVRPALRRQMHLRRPFQHAVDTVAVFAPLAKDSCTCRPADG